MTRFSAKTVVAGVTGRPIDHSLSPLIHNAWLQTAGIDAVYVALPCRERGFAALVEGLRGGVLRGLNVTAPFKEEALAACDHASERANRAGAANLLVFEDDGAVVADNTDGEGLLAALRLQAPAFEPCDGPAVILGAGGAARGAAAALLEAGSPAISFVNRSPDRSACLARHLGERVNTRGIDAAAAAFAGASLVLSTLPAGVPLDKILIAGLAEAAPTAVIMDMAYDPLETPLLERARALGLRTVDGLAMLIGQARPSFERLFGRPPPAMDVRALAEESLGARP